MLFLLAFNAGRHRKHGKHPWRSEYSHNRTLAYLFSFRRQIAARKINNRPFESVVPVALVFTVTSTKRQRVDSSSKSSRHTPCAVREMATSFALRHAISHIVNSSVGTIPDLRIAAVARVAIVPVNQIDRTIRPSAQIDATEPPVVC